MSADNQYYYAVGGQVHGPVPVESLVAMYQSRHLADTTMICPVGSKNWTSMSEILKEYPHKLVAHSNQDTKPLEFPTVKKNKNGSSLALNMLAVFCLIPCVFIIFLSVVNYKVFVDLWGIAVLSVIVALFWAILARLVGGKS